MHKHRLKLELIAAPVAIAISVILFSQSASLRIAYHLSGLRSAQMSFARPTSLKGCFSVQGFEWLRSKGDWLTHGRRWHSDDERSKAANEHREALLQLGYFERREFAVNCVLGDFREADRLFMTMRSRLPLRCRLWQMKVVPFKDASHVTVCACASEMILWEQMVHDFNNRSGTLE